MCYNSELAKNGYFVTMGTYFTLLFELFFPVLVWVRAIRPLLIISGIGLHLGIYVFMMIHDFEILFLMIYPFFFSSKQLQRFYSKVTWLSNRFLFLINGIFYRSLTKIK
jgi:hypothetical protein